MSGGPYGRGKAPERTCMKPEAWPDEDRRLWQAACEPGDLLDDFIGARSDRRPITNRKAEKGYGRWLTYLSMNANESLRERPADRLNVQRVKGYIAHLQGLENSSATILARLQELGEVAKVMGPAQDWRFISQLASRIRARHVPARGKQHLKLSHELFGLGDRLMEEASTKAGWRGAVLYRDGLLVAFLSLVPLRRKNIASLRLNHNLVKLNGSWSVILDANDSKTHAPFELDLPDLLVAPLLTYLTKYRPLLMKRRGRWYSDAGDMLWVSNHGSAMTQMAIYDRVRAHTKAAFEVAINPHLFRDSAATTMAIEDPLHVRAAAPLLAHRTFSTTERHYIQAKGQEAQRKFMAVVFGKRGR